MPPTAESGLLRRDDPTVLERLAESARAVDGVATSREQFEKWFAERCAAEEHQVTPVRFASMRKWSFDGATGNLVHESGRFFSVVGLHVKTGQGPVREWFQPIIRQQEIGVLGIAVREIDGVLHFLMQAKWEPGNPNGVQLSPTVQATKSNYTGVHRGRSVPYLEHFVDAQPRRVVADVLQSEQGAWFYRKRNRNMVVEVGPEVEAGEDFCWLTLGQLRRQLRIDHRVNMDSRTVLSCLPGPSPEADGRGALHTGTEVLSWITRTHAQQDVDTAVVPLDGLPAWHRSDWTISHERGMFFDVRAVDVVANRREVSGWSQPLVQPCGVGVVALLVKRFDGVLHMLMRTRLEPGYVDVIELSPTVQGTPENHAGLSSTTYAEILELEQHRRDGKVLFEAEMSEEGGRFYHSRCRYMIIEVGADYPDQEQPGFCWMTVPQVTGLLRYRHYLNVQARTLMTCLRACTA